MRSDAQGRHDAPDATLQRVDDAQIEVVVMVVRDEEKVDRGEGGGRKHVRSGKGFHDARHGRGEGEGRVDEDRYAFHSQKVPGVPEPDEFVLSDVRESCLHVRDDARGLSPLVRAEKKVNHVPCEGLLRGTGLQGIEIAEFPVLPVRACENPFEPAAARRSAEVFARENAARSRKKGAAKE